VLAVGAHPDDVELGCGGLLARLAASGRSVGIVDLTAGELGTRGDVGERSGEAVAAAAVLGAAWRACLGLPDGGLHGDDEGQLAAIVEALRAGRPRVVLLPDGDDPHPDHGAAFRLVVQACTWSGVRRWHPEAGDPHRPRLLLTYPGPRQALEPDLVVDVSASHAAKREACAAHRSQFDPAAGPPTHLASGHFLAAVDGRDRAAGNLVGVEYGEGYGAVGALPADELAWLLTTGVRGPGSGVRAASQDARAEQRAFALQEDRAYQDAPQVGAVGARDEAGSRAEREGVRTPDPGPRTPEREGA
jgi:bacillithiol biosynthesis deacetylase BshB1